MARGEGRRIHHTKSRLGCRRCKARKVKCDEVRPICGNCVKYETTCQYVNGPAATGTLSSPSPISEEQAQRTASPDPATSATPVTETGQSRSAEWLLELQLMHHYTSDTSRNAFMASHDEGVKDIYARLAPILALKHEFLMDALLSAAALHMSKLNPEKAEFADAHRKYFESAVIYQRQAVNIINPDNADAICLAALLISFQALVMPPESRTYSPPSGWLDLATGNAMLFRSAWSWLKESKRILAIVDAEPNLQKFNEKCWEEYPDIFPPHIESISPMLLEFQDSSEDLNPERTSVYKWTLGYVGLTLQLIESDEDPSKVRRVLSAFGAMVPGIFKILVKKRQPRALVILAHYFSIMKAVDDVWWLRGVAEREVFGIQSLLPERWQWAMAWPLQKLAFYAAAAVPPQEGRENIER